MARKSRIPAAEAATGKRYRSLEGRTVVLLRRCNTKGKEILPKSHPRCPHRGWLPYKSPGQSRAKDAIKRVSLRGWIPPTYLLLED